MARRAYSGFELQSLPSSSADLVDGLTWSAAAGSTRLLVETGIKRSGDACLKYIGSSPEYVSLPGVAATNVYQYARFWVYLASLPSNSLTPAQWRSGTIGSSTLVVSITLSTGGVFTINGGTGSSSALSTGQWYCIETSAVGDGTNTINVELKVDGVVVSTRAITGTAVLPSHIRVGSTVATAASQTIYFDDVALNDSTGGAPHNNYPGLDGKILLLKPASDLAVGANWTKGQGGAISGSGYSSIDQVPPTGIADNTAGADNTQLRNATLSSTQPAADADFTMETGVSKGLLSVDTYTCAKAVSFAGDSSGTASRAVATALLSPSDGGETSWSTPLGAVGAFPTTWGYSDGAIVQAPGITASSAPTARFGRRNTSSGVMVLAFLGVMVEWEPGDQSIIEPTPINDGAMGTPTVAPGAVTISLTTGIASAENFGSVNIFTSTVLSPTGIASDEAFGTPVIGQKVVPTSIDSEEAFGTAEVAIAGDFVNFSATMGLKAGLEGELRLLPTPTPDTTGYKTYRISTGSADGGTFTFTVDGDTTVVAWNETVGAFLTLILALSTVDPGEVDVRGAPGLWYVTLPDTMVVSVDFSGLTQSDSAGPPAPDLPGSLSESASFDERWSSGQHIGQYRPVFQAAVRRGRFNRSFKLWPDPPIDVERYGLDPNRPWQATWHPDEEYVAIPGVSACDIDQSFDQDGLMNFTLNVENIAYVEEEGGQHSFHRGWMSALRGYVADGRTALTDEQGVTVEENEWFDKLRENAQVTIWQGYGDSIKKIFTGLIDDIDTTSRPDTITLTGRDFGGVLADERVFGWNKEKDIIDPVIFIDRDDAVEKTTVSYSPSASGSRDADHNSDKAADTDSESQWWSDLQNDSDDLVYVQVKLPAGSYSKVRLRLPDDFEVYIAIRPEGVHHFITETTDNPTFDGTEYPSGEWLDLGNGDIDGHPWVIHDNYAEGAYDIDLGGVLVVGQDTLLRAYLTDLQPNPDAGTTGEIGFVGMVTTLGGEKEALSAEAIHQHWYRVGDVTDVVKVVLRWAGFKEWEIEDAGVPLQKRLVVNRGMTYMDVIKLVKDAIGYDFSMRGPTADDLSIGVPVFRKSRAVTEDDPVQTVTDELLLSAVRMRASDENRAYIIRVRGRESKTGKTLGADRTKRVMYTYRPPWSGPVHTEKWRRNGGVLRHLIHTDNLIKTVNGCRIACYYIALQEALSALLATAQFPAHPDIYLDDHVELRDLGTGLSTRVNVRERHLSFTSGEDASAMMTIGGALIDTPDVQEIVGLINEAADAS